jgi:hypothetical protein
MTTQFTASFRDIVNNVKSGDTFVIVSQFTGEVLADSELYTSTDDGYFFLHENPDLKINFIYGGSHFNGDNAVHYLTFISYAN